MTSCENTLNTLRYANRWEYVDLLQWFGPCFIATGINQTYAMLWNDSSLNFLYNPQWFLYSFELAVTMLLLYISLPTLSSSVWLSCIPSLLSFSCSVSLFAPALCSTVPWCAWCRCVEWRSLGLVRRTSPSPRAVRGEALITRPPIPLSMMTLLLPLPAGQGLPKAQHCTLTHKTHTMHVLPPGIYYIMIYTSMSSF